MQSRPRHILDLPDEILHLILAYCCEDLDFLLYPYALATKENHLCPNGCYCAPHHEFNGQFSGATTKPQLLSNSNREGRPTKVRRIHILSGSNYRYFICGARQGTLRQAITDDSLIRTSGESNGIPRDLKNSIAYHTALRKRPQRFSKLAFRSQRLLDPSISHILSSGSTNPSISFVPQLSCQTRQTCVLTTKSERTEPTELPQGLIAYVSKTTPLPDALSLCRPSLGNDTAGKEYNAQNVHSSLASHSTRHLQPRNRNRRSILDAAGSSPYSRALHSSLSLQTLPTEIALKKKGNKIERLCKRDDEKEGPEEAQEKVHKNNVCRHSIPNQLMLVNKRFADLVVPMLWRRIVFHGHQTCRSRSLFSALHQVDEKAGLALKKPFESNAFSRDGSCLKHPKRHVFKASLNIMTKRFNAYTSATIKGISAAEQSSGFNHESSCSRRHAIEDRLTSVTHYQKHAGEARWSYGQFVRHVVLNFAHPQASPEMLIKALECLGSRCQNQIQALDLHANEKMQVFGLETPTDMSRLLGTGFSKLRFLRMQGGLVDNQLFCALINGLVEPTATSCRLSQVFLGPGSITDSAIDKLIIAAAQCLEVFHVTSCVDVGGKAIASLLTSCPKLRVLSVHRSLARDKDLLEGLGIEIEANNSLSVVPTPYNLSRVATNEIVAPLERFELGTTKLTTSGITEIIKGTCCSLRFLVLETQHFQDDFLRGVIAPLCKKLEGLYFDESDRSYQQRNPSALRHGQNQEQRTRRRLFDFGRWRGAMANQLEQISLQPQSNLGPHNVSQRNHEMLEERTTPKQSPWLALTSTDAWVLHGRCALWATNSIRSSATVHGMGAAYGGDNLRTSISENFLPEQSRIRPFTVYFRAIRRRFISLLSTTSATTSIDNDNNIQGSVSTMSPLSSIPSVSLGSDMSTESGYQRVLRRFGVHTTTIEVILRSLQHSLKEFSVIEVDLIAASAESSSDGSKMSAENSFVAPDWTPYLG